MEHDLDKALNMKLILCIFEQHSGLKINFHKSEIFCFGKAKENQDEYKILFGCDIGALPFKYLGIPIHFKKLKNGEWKPVEGRFEKKLSSWIGKILLYGDRLVLINSVLTSLPMFMIRFFKYLKGLGRDLIIIVPGFFGNVMNTKRNIDLPSGILFINLEIKGV
jgi:hypothetical protein